MKETKEEFVRGWLARNKLTEKAFQKINLAAIPCDCTENTCKGWKMAYKDRYQVARQLQGLTVMQ